MSFTITFCDVAENHHGMQKIGELSENGVTLEDLEYISERFENSVIHDLGGDVHILIIKNGIEQLHLDNDDLYEELMSLNWDTKAWMRGRVVNKRARYNLCFGNESQEPDYENKEGRVISWKEAEHLSILHSCIESSFDLGELKAEGNYYYDNKCGIGFHGDAERKIVIGVRFGESHPLVFQWYQHSKPISDSIVFELEEGDIYVMDEKATGNDWKKRKIATLRHAAGSSKYTKLDKK